MALSAEEELENWLQRRGFDVSPAPGKQGYFTTYEGYEPYDEQRRPQVRIYYRAASQSKDPRHLKRVVEVLNALGVPWKHGRNVYGYHWITVPICPELDCELPAPEQPAS